MKHIAIGSALIVLAAVLLVPLTGLIDQAVYNRANHRAAAAIGGAPGADLATTLSKRAEERSVDLEDLLAWLGDAGVDYEARWIDSTARGALRRLSIEYPLTTIDGVVDVDFAHGNIVRVDGSGYLAPSGGRGVDSMRVNSAAGHGAWRRIENRNVKDSP